MQPPVLEIWCLTLEGWNEIGAGGLITKEIVNTNLFGGSDGAWADCMGV